MKRILTLAVCLGLASVMAAEAKDKGKGRDKGGETSAESGLQVREAGTENREAEANSMVGGIVAKAADALWAVIVAYVRRSRQWSRPM